MDNNPFRPPQTPVDFSDLKGKNDPVLYSGLLLLAAAVARILCYIDAFYFQVLAEFRGYPDWKSGLVVSALYSGSVLYLQKRFPSKFLILALVLLPLEGLAWFQISAMEILSESQFGENQPGWIIFFNVPVLAGAMWPFLVVFASLAFRWNARRRLVALFAVSQFLMIFVWLALMAIMRFFEFWEGYLWARLTHNTADGIKGIVQAMALILIYREGASQPETGSATDSAYGSGSYFSRAGGLEPRE